MQQLSWQKLRVDVLTIRPVLWIRIRSDTYHVILLVPDTIRNLSLRNESESCLLPFNIFLGYAYTYEVQ
jgi:hypothetical protein